MKQSSGQKAALPSDLKRRNYTAILKSFRSGEVLSANDIALETGISRQTVMKAITHFTNKGLLASAGKGESTEIGGKKPELFHFCMERYLLCIGHSGETMMFCLYDLTCRLVAKVSEQVSPNRPLEEVLQIIDTKSDELLKKVEDGPHKLYGVCLVIGGIIDHNTGVFRYSALAPSWGRDVPLRDMIQQKFPQAVIEIENVARMAACAAVLDHAEYENQSVVSIYSDLGLSASYIEKGKVLYGRHTLIGEIGPMILDYSQAQQNQDANYGSFAYLVSEEYLNKRIRQNQQAFQQSTLHKYAGDIPLKKIFQAAEDKDALACDIVKDTARIFSAALGNIMFHFDPDTIIFQGSYAKAGAYFEACLMAELEKFPFEIEPKAFQVKFDPRPLLNLQLMGATKILTRRFFSSVEWLQ